MVEKALAVINRLVGSLQRLLTKAHGPDVQDSTRGPHSKMTKMSVEAYREDLEGLFKDNASVIFLCGPTLADLSNEGAKLRKHLMDALEGEGFEVVLGEDDGLEELRRRFDGYAHENELQFIQGHCNAIVLIAASVGAYCELGLFAYEHARGKDNQTDFILIIPKQFEGKRSYLSEGPAAAIHDFGKVYYVDFIDFDIDDMLRRLKRRRHVFVTSKQGQRAGRSS